MNITRALAVVLLGSFLLVLMSGDAHARRSGQVAPPPPPAPVADPEVSPS